MSDDIMGNAGGNDIDDTTMSDDNVIDLNLCTFENGGKCPVCGRVHSSQKTADRSNVAYLNLINGKHEEGYVTQQARLQAKKDQVDKELLDILGLDDI